MSVARQDDLVLLVSPDKKRYIILLSPGDVFHTHKGHLEHDHIIGHPLGREINSHLGHPFIALRPSIHDLVMNLRRNSAIVYPKEIGHILLKMSIGPGCHIVEAGTGSGALTTALAFAIRPNGRVYSYDSRANMTKLAAKNLDSLALSDYVELRQRDIRHGFDEKDANALFLDVREPWKYLEQAWEALECGGFFGSIVPTVNQVCSLVAALPCHGFAAVEVCEILIRPYKPVAGRLRPFDRMVAHTGYLIFARSLATVKPSLSQRAAAEQVPFIEPEDNDTSLACQSRPAIEVSQPPSEQ